MGLPVVSCPYMPAAETPIPCWPRCCLRRWNFNRTEACRRSSDLRLHDARAVVLDRDSEAPLFREFADLDASSGRDARFLTRRRGVVDRHRGQERLLLVVRSQRRWRFLTKNSETEISRCFSGISRRWRGAQAPADRLGRGQLLRVIFRSLGATSSATRLQATARARARSRSHRRERLRRFRARSF